MRLSRTPLFVDNTNMALWEMSAYVALAEQHGYDVMIIGPEQLGDVGLPVLLQRCQDSARTSGKEIGQDVLERMLSRYEKLPDGIQGVLWASCAPELAAVRDAKPAPRYRYAGLDVEKQALEALAAIDLGPLFWEWVVLIVTHLALVVFNAMAAPKCAACGKSVYAAEEVKALDRSWHQLCFCCTACGKSLRGGQYKDHEGQPYCEADHKKLFGPKGIGFGTLADTGTGAAAPDASVESAGVSVKDRLAAFQGKLAAGERPKATPAVAARFHQLPQNALPATKASMQLKR
ncbi:unnamed protein product [Effrenium voratum]|nr:unnamed protein product [Effrenium voratum]